MKVPWKLNNLKVLTQQAGNHSHINRHGSLTTRFISGNS